MRRPDIIGGLIVAAFLMGASAATSSAWAGPWEDGMASYNRGDYLPAMRLFRPLAEAGNPKAQSVIGVMYRRGEGVARSTSRAFMWLSLAARRGDSRAKSDLRDISRTMSREEVSQAQAMMQACEASNYRDCGY